MCDLHGYLKERELLSTRNYYFQLKFENDFMKKRGDEFQQFCSNLLSLCEEENFQATRTWGREGDWKCDGRLEEERAIIQVYAPDEMKADSAIRKIDKDFDGALSRWHDWMKVWIFLHNAKNGLSPQILDKLDKLKSGNPHVTIVLWDYHILLDLFDNLSDDKKIQLVGFIPVDGDLIVKGYSSVAEVVDKIAKIPYQPIESIQTVSVEKLDFNDFSERAKNLILNGMKSSYIVGNYFSACNDPSLGDSIAQAFSQKYKEFRKDYKPDKIFNLLRVWAVGNEWKDANCEVAVYAVIAYFFEKCDIFEAPGK